MVSFIKNTVFIIVVGFLIVSLTRNIFDYYKKIAFYQNYQTQFNNEKEKKLKLESEIKKSQDYYTVEKAIREKLNLLKDNEIAIILPQRTPSPTIKIKPKTVPEQWIELMVKK